MANSEFIGRAVAKSFKGYGKRKFKGTVTAVSEENGDPWFRIKYEDGDEEDVSLGGLKRILVPAAGGAAAGQQRKRKAPAASEEQLEAEEEEEQQQGDEQPEAAAAAAAGPSGRRRGREPEARRPADSAGVTAELGGLVADVAASSRALQCGITRVAAQPAADGEALCSKAVTCGGVCYLSAFRPVETTENAYLPEIKGTLSGQEYIDYNRQSTAVYKAQANEVLGQLEDALREAGTSKDHLLSVTWLLKDLPYGKDPISDVWNRWVNPRALPALTMQESYLGQENVHVSILATAAVPPQPYA